MISYVRIHLISLRFLKTMETHSTGGGVSNVILTKDYLNESCSRFLVISGEETRSLIGHLSIKESVTLVRFPSNRQNNCYTT